MIHGEDFSRKHDMNDDSFLDKPLQSQLNFYNKWKFDNHKNIHAQFGINLLTETRKAGQVDFIRGMTREPSNPYGIEIQTERLELFSKTAWLFERATTSLAYIQSFTYHDQESFFGLNDYIAKEYNYYGNLMYQSYIGNTNHVYTAGLSFNYDRFDENLNDSSFIKTERVPGGFLEYTYTNPEKFTFIAGIRADFHNLYGTLITPRLHAKYDINAHNVIRASAGKGYRSPNIIAENTYMLATSKNINFIEEPGIEEAWNFGLNYTRYFDIYGKELAVNTEFYRTDFRNQIVIDRDTDISQILIYNLNGRSYSNSFQIESNYELFEGFDLTTAFRYNDVKVTINDELRRKPLVNKYKGLLSFSYSPGVRWQFDFTTQLNGDSRLPETDQLPEKYQKAESSPVYTILNAQITRNFRTWSVYLGGENLTNYKQKDPIIAAGDPYGEYFDSSLVWGPLMGIKVYAGIRFSIED
jgi:outer membrane receptor for ferrienterochelin and colicin